MWIGRSSTQGPMTCTMFPQPVTERMRAEASTDTCMKMQQAPKQAPVSFHYIIPDSLSTSTTSHQNIQTDAEIETLEAC